VRACAWSAKNGLNAKKNAPKLVIIIVIKIIIVIVN